MEEPIELMQRGRIRERSAESVATERTCIERKIKPDDTLNKIALQYSVKVSDLKRMNNMLSDQDFAGRSSIKIPMSKLRRALRLGMESESDGGNEGTMEVCNRPQQLFNLPLNADERQGLLNTPDPSVEHLFSKTDATIAQVRESLGEENGKGSFHFMDARPPQSSHTPIWMLLLAVVVVFVVLPLFVVYEETEDSKDNHTHYHNSIPHHSN